MGGPSKVPIMNGLTNGRQEILESGAICPFILVPDVETIVTFFLLWSSLVLGNEGGQYHFVERAWPAKFEPRCRSLKSSSASRAHLRQENDFSE